MILGLSSWPSLSKFPSLFKSFLCSCIAPTWLCFSRTTSLFLPTGAIKDFRLAMLWVLVSAKLGSRLWTRLWWHMKFIYSPLWEKANFWSRSLSVSWLETGETIAFEFLYLTYHPIDFDWPPSEASSSELLPWFPLNSSLSLWLSWLSLSVSFDGSTWF